MRGDADGQPVEQQRVVAEAYRRRFRGDPRALRDIADLYLQMDDLDSARDVLYEVVRGGMGSVDDLAGILTIRLRMVRFRPAKLDEPSYREGLSWLDAKLTLAPSCSAWELLVRWTSGRDEQDRAIDRALKGCARESLRGAWLAKRAVSRAAHTEDACDAVAYGSFEPEVAQLCIAHARPTWKVAVARANLDEDPLANLRLAISAPDVTVSVLKRFARGRGISLSERCDAMARARAKEVAATEDRVEKAGVASVYIGMQRGFGCSETP